MLARLPSASWMLRMAPWKRPSRIGSPTGALKRLWSMWRETVTGGLAMICTAMSPSRYVSDDLVHFVGRSAVSDDDAFSRLAAIFQDGWLLTPTAFAIEDRDENVSNFSLKPNVKLSSNDRYIPEMVCFADIPEEALHIHTAKYRRFGLAFSKRFLVASHGPGDLKLRA
jgi:hypothetical protein